MSEKLEANRPGSDDRQGSGSDPALDRSASDPALDRSASDSALDSNASDSALDSNASDSALDGSVSDVAALGASESAAVNLAEKTRQMVDESAGGTGDDAAGRGPGRGRGVADEMQVLGTRDIAMVRAMWHFLRPYKRLFFLSLALLPLISACLLVQPWIIKQAIDQCIAVGTTEGLWFWVLAYIAAFATEFALLYWQNVVTMLLAQKSLADLRLAVFRKIESMDTAFFDRNPVGRLVTRMTTDVDVINEMFAAGAITMLMDAMTLVGIVVIMFVLHAELTLAALATLPIMLLLVDFFRRKTRKYYRLIRDRIALINSYLQESISGMAVVHLFASEARMSSEFGELNSAYRDANHWSNIYEASLFSIVEAVSAISTAAILWYGAHLVVGEPMSTTSLVSGAVGFGTLVAFMEYINRFFVPVRDFSTKYAVMQSAITACEKVFGLLELEPVLRNPDQAVPAPPRTGTIEFDDVWFSYIPGEHVLRGVSFRVAAGEHVAIVGATGSGKTTITKLLARFYDVERGRVLVDGVDVREWDLGDLRRRIVTVLQDVFLFSGTAADNIRLGRDDISDQEVRDAARAVHADRFLERLPEGYDAPVRERGNNFSTGQRQLLSFARALAYKPDILVLDEATSSVDHDTEELIQDAVAKLQEGRTSLVIAHRLATIEGADRIMVLHHGVLRESGTHEELMKLGGLYARLYLLQHDESETRPPATTGSLATTG